MANGETAVKVVAGAGAVIVQAGAVLATLNPATIVAIGGSIAMATIGCMIACRIGTRGKSVKFKVGEMFDVEAEFR